MNARQFGGIFRSLTLGIVEIGGYSNDGSGQIFVESVFYPLPQGRKNFSGDFNRTFGACNRFDFDHARIVEKLVGHAFPVGNVGEAASHHTFDRYDGIFGIGILGFPGGVTDLCMTVREIADNRRQQRTSLFVVQHFGNTVSDGCDKRMSRAEIDPDCQPELMGGSGHTRFCDLEKCHLFNLLNQVRRMPD